MTYRRSIFAVAIMLLASATRAEDTPYDIIQRAYAPYMQADDPLAFGMKVRSLASDPYKFWRGSKDLFFLWCKTNTTDWLADAKAYLPNHGDLHLGNIGTYACDSGWDRLAFGMVDFDDSAVLPFQLELLQGAITLDLVARQNGVALDAAASDQIFKTLFDAYRVSVNSRRNATDLLTDSGDPLVAKMLAKKSLPYQDELDHFTEDGKFRRLVYNEKHKLKEILRPAMARADDFAAGLAEAMVNEPQAGRLFRANDDTDLRTAIEDIVQRTRLGSSGSQGLKKYLILLDHPLKKIDHDVIVYFKQEIPSAAERSGIVSPSPLSPGQRVKQDMDRMTMPGPYLNSWCNIGAESYWVTLKDPWGDELDPDDVKSSEGLLHMARIWGTVAGATHREDGHFELILPRLSPTLETQIRQRAKEFEKKLDEDLAAFEADARVQTHLDAVEGFLKAIASAR